MTDSSVKQLGFGHWLWAWAKIPLEFIASFMAASVLVSVGGDLLGKNAAKPLGLLVVGLLVVFIGRGFWNLNRLRKQGAPYFWAIAMISALGTGILLAIPIPQSITRFQSKARQSEAKITLVNLYTVEASYFAEYRSYVPNIEGLVGYSAPGRFYVVGFPDACAGKTGSAGKALTTTPAGIAALTNAQRQAVQDFFHNVRDCPDPASGFEAYAVGFIRPGGPLDVWKINQGKLLENLQPGF